MRVIKRTTSLFILLLLVMAGQSMVSAATLNFDELITTISPWDGTPNPADGDEAAYLPWDYGGFVWNH